MRTFANEAVQIEPQDFDQDVEHPCCGLENKNQRSQTSASSESLGEKKFVVKRKINHTNFLLFHFILNILKFIFK